MKTESGLMMGRLVCGAVLLIGRLAVAQNVGNAGDGAIATGPMISRHGSAGRDDSSDPNLQAIARETADALEGRIEGPVMTPTRSSFLAKWPAAARATGYRLDVSTSPSFDSYVSGYQDRDLGNVTNQIVSGLERGTQYYYRVRAYDAAGIVGDSSETTPATTANTTSGLVITPTFDSTITSDPRSNAIQAMIISTIDTYQKLFADPITVNILFRLSTLHADGRPLERNLVAASDSPIYATDWNAYVNA